MPVAMALLQWIGVCGCGFPSSCKVSLVILASFAFRNSDPSSASADYAATNLIIRQSVNISPLRCMGCLPCVLRPRKKCLAAHLLGYLSGKYDASTWTFRIMLEA